MRHARVNSLMTHAQRIPTAILLTAGVVLVVAAVASAWFSVQTSDVLLEFNGREIDPRFEKRVAAFLAIVLGSAGIACLRVGWRGRKPF